MNSILIIEDETKVSDVIKAYLEKEGYKVFCATLGVKGIEIFEENNIDLVLLDLMLPDINGEDVCRIIRRKSDVHIFMLTAKGSLDEKIGGLSIGADEYLVKPFSPRELVARVNAIFRRINKEDQIKKLTFNSGDMIIDLEGRTVSINGEEALLTANEFDILFLLANNKGKVFSREQIIERAFGINFEGFDRTIDVHIKNIRKKIEKDSKNPEYIQTVVKAGYKFTAI